MIKPEQKRVLSPHGIGVPRWAHKLAAGTVRHQETELAEGAVATIEVFAGDDASMVIASFPGALKLSPSGFHDSVALLASTVLAELSECRHPHPARMWNFIPGIHDEVTEHGNRYELFNEGRFTGFCKWFGNEQSFPTMLPAASAVGHDHDRLIMTALGTRAEGRRIDNPRQVPAFRYSKDHGVRPPCFVRAVLTEFRDGPRLLVSGTASILGEDSMHRASIELQTKETFRNLDHLVRNASCTHDFSLEGVESARVYHPGASNRGWLMDAVQRRLPATASLEFVPAWLCRPELLVEIEMTIVPCPS